MVEHRNMKATRTMVVVKRIRIRRSLQANLTLPSGDSQGRIQGPNSGAESKEAQIAMTKIRVLGSAFPSPICLHQDYYGKYMTLYHVRKGCQIPLGRIHPRS